MAFRKGRGTKRCHISTQDYNRGISAGRQECVCMLCGLQKTFDRINHDKLLEIVEIADILELDRKLIKNLYYTSELFDKRGHSRCVMNWFPSSKAISSSVHFLLYRSAATALCHMWITWRLLTIKENCAYLLSLRLKISS